MATLKITPNFIPDNGQLFFSAQELNSLQRSAYTDTFGFYQRLFGVFSYMQLNKKNKFVVHTPKGHPLVWQPWKACAYNETGSLTINTRELIPDPIYLKERFCHDELLFSAYEHMLEWSASGMVDLDDEGTRLLNTLIEEFMANAAYGLRMTATAGDLYDISTVPLSADNTATLNELIALTHNTFKGWLKLSMDLAANEGKGWMNLAVTDDQDFDEVTGFTGNILDLFDTLKANARKPLRQLINRGGIVREGRFTFLPLIVLSDSYFNAVVDRYNFESDRVATNRVRLTMRSFGGENSPTPQRVFYLDDMLPIIPMEEINGFDTYLKGQTHFAGIIASGNVQLGSSFAGIPENIENPNIGMMIGRNNDITRDDYGKFSVLSHALTKVAIADPEYFVGTTTYTEPA